MGFVSIPVVNHVLRDYREKKNIKTEKLFEYLESFWPLEQSGHLFSGEICFGEVASAGVCVEVGFDRFLIAFR